jgi:hypothetical protein
MVGEYRLLAETIEETLTNQSRTAKSCGRELSPQLKLSPKSTEEWINSARRGQIYGTIGTPLNPNKQLGRLSHLLHYLGISPESEVIQGIRERDQRFIYPPEEDRNPQITYQNLEVLLKEVEPSDYPAVQDYLTEIIKRD